MCLKKIFLSTLMVTSMLSGIAQARVKHFNCELWNGSAPVSMGSYHLLVTEDQTFDTRSASEFRVVSASNQDFEVTGELTVSAQKEYINVHLKDRHRDIVISNRSRQNGISVASPINIVDVDYTRPDGSIVVARCKTVMHRP